MDWRSWFRLPHKVYLVSREEGSIFGLYSEHGKDKGNYYLINKRERERERERERYIYIHTHIFGLQSEHWPNWLVFANDSSRHRASSLTSRCWGRLGGGTRRNGTF